MTSTQKDSLNYGAVKLRSWLRKQILPTVQPSTLDAAGFCSGVVCLIHVFSYSICRSLVYKHRSSAVFGAFHRQQLKPSFRHFSYKQRLYLQVFSLSILTFPPISISRTLSAFSSPNSHSSLLRPCRTHLNPPLFPQPITQPRIAPVSAFTVQLNSPSTAITPLSAAMPSSWPFSPYAWPFKSASE